MFRLVSIIAKIGHPIRGLVANTRYDQVSGVNLEQWVIAPRSSLIGIGNEVVCYFWETDRIYHQVAKMVYQSVFHQLVVFRLSGCPVESAVSDTSLSDMIAQDGLKWVSWKGCGIQCHNAKIDSVQYHHDGKHSALLGSRYQITGAPSDLFSEKNTMGAVLFLGGIPFGMTVYQTERHGYLVHWDALIAASRVADRYQESRTMRLDDPLRPRGLSNIVIRRGVVLAAIIRSSISDAKLQPGDQIVGIDDREIMCMDGWDQMLVVGGGRSWSFSEYLSLGKIEEPRQLWINRNSELLMVSHSSCVISSPIQVSGILPFSREMIIHSIPIPTAFLDQLLPRNGVITIARLSIDLINHGGPKIVALLATEYDPLKEWIIIECTDLILAQKYQLPCSENEYPPKYVAAIDNHPMIDLSSLDLTFVSKISIYSSSNKGDLRRVDIPCINW